MRINFNPVRFNNINNHTAFGRKFGKISSQVRKINHEFGIKSSFLNELSRETSMPQKAYNEQSIKFKNKRDYAMSLLTGEDMPNNDEFLERLTY